MSDEVQLSKESSVCGEFDNEIIASKQLHKQSENLGYMSSQRIVPRIRIHGIILEEESTVYDESDLKYDTVYESYNLDSKDTPFIDSNELNLYMRRYSNELINKYTIVKEFSEIVNLESKDHFLIDSQEKNNGKIYYVCSIKYDLIGKFNAGTDMYEKKILYKEYDSIENMLRTRFTQLNSVEYKFDDSGELGIRNKSNNKFDISPEKFDYYIKKYAQISFGILISSSLFGLFLPNIFIYPLLLSIMSFFGIVGIKEYYDEIIDNPWIYPEGVYEDKGGISFGVINIRNMYNENHKNPQYKHNAISSEVKLTDNKLVDEKTSITWSIYNSSYEVYEKRAIEFFKDMGFESIQTEFAGTIIPNENMEKYDCEFLISDCGEYALLAR